MAYDPDFDERQRLMSDGWEPTRDGGGFQKETSEGHFWIGLPSGSRNHKYIVEVVHNGVKRHLGNATTIRGALKVVGRAKKPLRESRHVNPKKRRVGRIVTDVASLQEKLDTELLRGQTIVWKGEVFRIGNFLNDGLEVELWRE